MIELFTAHTVIDRFKRHGLIYKDVVFRWFVDREESLIVPSDVLPPIGPSEDDRRQMFIDECFTADELKLFLAWHQKSDWSNLTVERVKFPVVQNFAGYGFRGADGMDNIIDFSSTDDGNLPFRINAYYDLYDCEVATDLSAIYTMYAEVKELAHKWTTNGCQVKTDCIRYCDLGTTPSTVIGDDTEDSIHHGKITISFSVPTGNSCA